MNNKTKTYLLIAVVLGIWGTIGYKIINGLNPDEPEIATQDFNNTFKPKTITEVESFAIQDVERDPFLGTLANKKKSVVSTAPSKKKEPVKNNPVITYTGIIKKQNTADQIFVVNINNKQYLLKQGKIADSVKLLRGNTKEIVVRFNNTTQTIKRQ